MMESEREIHDLLSAWRVDAGYRDHRGRWRDVPGPTLEAILDVMGADGPSPEPRARVVRNDDVLSFPVSTTLVLEDGTKVASADLPPELPLGYHTAMDEAAEEITRVVVTPGRCYLPASLRTWGWAVQPYVLRTRSSWGIGDLEGVRRLAHGSSGMGAGILMLGPLHAANPGIPQEPSPYYPGSRCFKNPGYLAVDRVPGFGELPDDDELLGVARALNSASRIDHDSVHVAKMRALEACWRRRRGDDARLERFVAEQGDTLELFATFAALVERYGRDWRTWPEGVRRPDGPEVGRFRRDAHDRVMFHCWLQLLVDEQLEAASEPLSIVHDLAIGVDPDGADAWIWQDVFAPGISIGAPPDAYNPAGQSWGVSAFDPWKLQDAAYEPFVRMVRSTMRHAGGMRFDHVMGLFRLFWIPADTGPSEGAYVRYPSDDLLGILALESHRAGAFVVGEDLGTVEPAVREEMAARAMLSYKLLWFEETPPKEWPRLSVGAATSHDLPTTKGLWDGTDVAFQADHGMKPDVDAAARLADRLAAVTGCSRSAPARDVIARSHELVARSGSGIAVTTLEDALEMEERHNYPGTTGPWNWTLPLPAAVEDVLVDDRVTGLASTMSEHRAGTVPP